MYRVNEVKDPLFNTDVVSSNSVTVSRVTIGNGNRYVKCSYDSAINDTDPYVNVELSKVPNGEYVFTCQLYCENAGGRVILYANDGAERISVHENWTGYGSANATTNIRINNINLRHGGFMLRLMPNRVEKALIMMTKPSLELASTFDESLPYFDYRTAPLSLGGGVG